MCCYRESSKIVLIVSHAWNKRLYSKVNKDVIMCKIWMLYAYRNFFSVGNEKVS